ncbi:hypothetical protein [Basfia succiniciproducens]|uniref:hypothetical protein n=1 Tax=Basfia succiniciproducens TaxID=653940 RepID=UPI0008AC0706|nr:hypothetical protein [Basfia succiniciproducens]SEP87019.1 hypothetical protein SAMN02910415_00549 [Basfia succiniciproducens]SEQ65452.1 hypothetical protein SAMN02910415_01837 [Basfia succiniciproducens]
MKNNKTDTLLFLEQLARYLTAKNWQIAFELEYAIIWQRELRHQILEITIPKPSAEDGDEVLKKTLEKLANFEEKTVETLKLNISNQYTDKLSVRVVGESVKDGTIPLDDGVKLFEKTKHLINALALSAKRKKAVFGHNSGGKNVAEFMSQVRLGQTQIGSYIINLSYPVENIEVKEQNEIIQAISFSRSVSHNLANSLKKLKEKITHYENNPTSFAELIPEGVSHNLCEAIIGLSGSEQQRKVEIKLQAGEINDEAMPSEINIQFDQNEIKVVQIASKYYQGEYTLPHYEIIGKIVGLHSSNLAEGGYIQVPCKIENKSVEIRIDLSPEQYQLAAEAHKNGQQIRCKGENLYINKKKGRLQKLTSMNTL